MLRPEKRSFRRRKVEFIVKYSCDTSGEQISGRARTRNISAGGIYFISLDPLRTGELIVCEFEVPGTKIPFEMEGHVVRREEMSVTMVPKWGIAIEFLPGSRRRNYLEKLLRDL